MPRLSAPVHDEENDDAARYDDPRGAARAHICPYKPYPNESFDDPSRSISMQHIHNDDAARR